MAFSSIMDRLRKMKENFDAELTPDVEDKQLVSLQRQRQRQLNIMQKERLKREIKDYNKKEFERNMGFGKCSKKITYGHSKAAILNDSNNLLSVRPLKRAKNILK